MKVEGGGIRRLEFVPGDGVANSKTIFGTEANRNLSAKVDTTIS